MNEVSAQASPDSRPLLSFVLFAYNHERFIEQAVLGAFRQTYSPLEIILSDDCSTDSTFNIIRRLTAEYSGPHRIILNRNETNSGTLGTHVNRAFQLASGELLVVAAGDDVSDPERVTRNFEAWHTTGRRAHCLYSGYSVIDEYGRPMEHTGMEFLHVTDGTFLEEPVAPAGFVEGGRPKLVGCAMAYTPEVMRLFGPLPQGSVQEDCALGFRACLLGPLVRIQQNLVQYRIHASNTSGHIYCAQRSRNELRRMELRDREKLGYRSIMFEGYERDLQTGLRLSVMAADEAERLARLARHRAELLSTTKVYEETTVFGKVALWRRMRRLGIRRRRLISRFLPLEVYCLLKSVELFLRKVLGQ